MASIELTAEEAVFMAQKVAKHAAYLIECRDEPPPDKVRKLYAELTPWVELLRELQEELEITSQPPRSGRRGGADCVEVPFATVEEAV